MLNFWLKLKKPILALAPMAGLTDSAFRQICKDFGADVVYSEMASATALNYNPIKTLKILESNKKEAPYVIQLFGSNPTHFVKAVKIIIGKKTVSDCKKQKFEYHIPQGIDINFGCPVKKIKKQGAGAILMDNPKLAREIIKSVIAATNLPVSIKCRSEVNKINVLKFLDKINDLDIKAIMIHGRSMINGRAGEVNWKIIKKARDHFGGIILANGGVMTAEDAHNLIQKTEADGIGIARGALGKPWIFGAMVNDKLLMINGGHEKKSSVDKQILCEKNNYQPSNKEIFKTALRHSKLAYKLKGKTGIIEMRKHLCCYIHGIPNASELREKLVKVESLKNIEEIFKIIH